MKKQILLNNAYFIPLKIKMEFDNTLEQYKMNNLLLKKNKKAENQDG